MKVKILILFVVSFFMLSAFYAQDNIKAEKEILSVLKYGTADTFSKLITYEGEEGINRFPKGPFIDENGTLLFDFNQSPFYSIIYKNNKFELQKEQLISDLNFPLSGQNINGITISPNQIGIFVYTKNKIHFIGRLKSGHCIFATYDNPQDLYMREFVITRPDGTIEISLEIPWSASNIYEEGKSFYSWSFGNWGELYSLIAPPMDSEGYWNNGKKEIELVVSRNYLKYFGILNDDRIRLRKGPGTNTESLGTYPIKTGFRILENSGVKQTIGGVTDEWIKVRLLNGTEGYFFGQYVQNLYDGPGSPLPWPNVADWE